MNDPYVTARSLVKSFDGKPVLDGLSFTVQPGDIVGILGKNGAGKTTLLEILLGYSPATRGAVTVFGYDSYAMPGDAKARVGFVPQQDELIGHLTAADQLRVIRSFYSRWDDDLIDRLMNKWGIDPAERIHRMSVGQRQKLSILLALGHGPDLLILDEPVASLDPVARRHFLEQIVEVALDRTRSVVLSSHIVSDIERLANKIWIIQNGRLSWAGDLDDLTTSIQRIHLRSPSRIAADISIPNALSVDRLNGHTSAVVRDWSQALGDELSGLTGARIEREPMTLEEIFLELHR